MVWLQFIIGAVVIIVAGVHLTKYADRLGDHLNLGKLWVGVLILGLITSLPEAITSVVAVVSLKANDLAIGNLLGSNNFNPMLLVVMDVMYRQGSLTNAIEAKESHRLAALFAIVLTLLVLVEIFWSTIVGVFSLGPFSVAMSLVCIFYFVGMRLVASTSAREHAAEMNDGSSDSQKSSLTKIWLNVILSAIFVIGGAICLTGAADVIAEETGLGRTFVGSIFLAFVTSLPELVVSLSALKLGAFDLALGNIFGSNMSNIFILFVCSLFHFQSPILGEVSQTHVVTGFLSVLLTGIVLIGIHSKNKKSLFHLGWDSILMVILFGCGTALLYQLRS